MRRRELLKAAALTPLALMPQYTQRLPLLSLPNSATPTGLGVGAPWQEPQHVTSMLADLRPAWWYDWRFEQCGAPGYTPMIWNDCVWSNNSPMLESLFDRRPDLFWLLWNEPERTDQANMSPDSAAWMTAALAEYGIRYAAPGVSWGKNGMDWMDAYLAAGGPIPTHWHIHIYHTLTPAQWSLRWASWRVWMRESDCERPTIVSETNAWTEGIDGQCIMAEYMAEMLRTDDLLQAVAWFATRWEAWGVGHPDLLNADGTPTDVGAAFRRIRDKQAEN